TRRAVHMRDRRQCIPVFGAHIHNRDHVWHLRSRIDVEPLMRLLFRAGRSKRTEGFPHLDHCVDAVAHGGVAWIGKNTAVSQRSWTVLHAATVPGDYTSFGDQPGRLSASLIKGFETSHGNAAG